MEEEKTNKRKRTDEEELEEFLRLNPFVYDKRSPYRAVDHPLHAAALRGRDDLVSYLVQEKRVEVNSELPDGETPLMRAVVHHHLSTARLLLELGADPKSKNMYDLNALHIAMCKRDKPMIRLLVEYGESAPPMSVISVIIISFRYTEQIAHFVHDLLMEKLFSRVTAGGICSNGQFRDFLAEGVCDPRLLIHIASFAYN